MAKVTRSVLKEMVKECLVEILSEGLVNSSDQLHESKKRKPRQRKTERVDASVFQERKKMLTDTISLDFTHVYDLLCACTAASAQNTDLSVESDPKLRLSPS